MKKNLVLFAICLSLFVTSKAQDSTGVRNYINTSLKKTGTTKQITFSLLNKAFNQVLNEAVRGDVKSSRIDSSAFTKLGTLRDTATLDFGSIAIDTCSTLTITVTGARSGDAVSLGIPNASVSTNIIYTAWVSASNTVTVRACNNSHLVAKDPPSGLFRVAIFKW